MATSPAPSLLSWLIRVTQFPRYRLSPSAELLLCFAAAAQAEEDAPGSGPSTAIVRRDQARDVALRHHELRRSHTHFKSDNSAKV